MKIILATLTALANAYSPHGSVNNQDAILANFAARSNNLRDRHSHDDDEEEKEHIHRPVAPSLYGESDDEQEGYVHIAPKPTVTYDSSTHNRSNSYSFNAVTDINDYTGDFEVKVDDFDSNDEIWNQSDYEERLETEAELMVALEAIRGALVLLDTDIAQLENCIELGADDIGVNYESIKYNDVLVSVCDEEIEVQHGRIESLQGRCRSM